MKREDFYFESRDGKTKVHAVKWIPDEKPVLILQLIHGMAEHIMRYDDFATWLCNQGVLVVGDDHLGHGLTATEESLFGYFCSNDPATVVVRDEHRLKKIIQEQYPGVKYFILGHSMGSLILRNYISRYGSGIDGAIICGTAQQPKLLVKAGLLLVGLLTVIYGPKHRSKLVNTIALGDNSKNGPEHVNDWICTDEAVVQQYTKDPLCGFTFTLNGFKTLFTIVDRNNNANNVEAIPNGLPMMIISGSEDVVGNCGIGVKKVFDEYKKYGKHDVYMRIYDGSRHEILNEKMKEDIYKDVYNWIISKI